MLRLFIVFLFLSLFPSLANPDNPYLASSDPSNYTCQVNQECLNYLNDTLLNKTSDRGIYKYCSDKYENIKLCCINPLECRESYGRNRSNELKNNSLNEMEESGTDVLSCHLNQLSSLISSLSGVQSEFCNVGLETCKSDCEYKLQEVKDSFRECFSIADSYNISAILEKARSSTKDQECYKEMIDIADKYKRQSLNKLSLLREDLKSQDIINCEDIKEVKTTKSLNNLAQNVCHQAKVQKEEKIQQEKAQAEQERQQAELEQEQRELEEAQRLKAEADLLGSGDINEWKERQRKMREEIDAKYGVDSSKEEASSSSSSNQNNNKNQSNNNNKGSSQGGLNKANLLGAGALGAGAGALGAGAGALGAGLSDDRFFKRKIYPTDKESLTNSTLDFPTEEEKPKGIFRRAWNKVKSFGKKAWTATKEKLAGLNKKARRGLASFMSAEANEPCEPQITHQMVYQSVEAPQIEPIDKQEVQDPNKPPIFKSYDLVRGKSAGVLVQIDRATCKWEDNKEFNLKMYVNNEDIVDMRCLPGLKLSNDPFVMQYNQNFCSFSIQDFDNQGNLSLFIRLPMGDGQALDIRGNDISVKIDIKEKTEQSVISSIGFKVNIIETKPISIALIPMTEDCPEDKIVHVDTIEDTKTLLSSTEIRYLRSIFPLAEVKEKRDLIDFLRIYHPRNGQETKMRYGGEFDLHRNGTLTIRSRCKGFKFIVSKGIIVNFLALKNMFDEIKEKRNRLFMVVTRDYMRKHYEDACGFATIHVPYIFGGDIFSKLGVVTVDDDCQGTLLHELAHTMGQERDFYKSAGNDCQKFRTIGDTVISCEDYTEERGLYSSFKETNISRREFFQWQKNNFSIMNNKGDLGDQWIDRETYQQIFNFLEHSYSIVPHNFHPETNELLPPIDPENPRIKYIVPRSINVSAIYDKQSNKFIHFQKNIVSKSKPSVEFDKSLYIENLDEDFKYIKFTLVKKDKGKPQGKPYITIFPQDMDFRVIYRGGRSETVRFPLTPVFVSLPIEGSGDFELTISTGVLSKEGEMREDKQIKKLEFKQEEPIAIM